MARRKSEEDEPERPAKGKKAPAARDLGSDTSPDTKLVNALESDPGFFKDPLIGQTLGKCKIGKLLGEGKTAVVYRALYEPLKRTVAVKVLQEHMKRVPAVLRVFQQEGKAVAALDHENILKIYDVGEDKGQHYLVLELLKGRDLLKRIEECGEEGLPLEEAVDYVRQAAAGLAAAHRKNLVHRDIKPQNLVVEPGGTLKIVDFGLAADVEGAFAGGRLGTPHYMSPEQCRGEGARTASDIYALGITLFHMLVGHPPYSGLHTTEEIIAEHLKGQKLEPEKLRRGLPRGVADLLRKMTRMDPDARPSAKELTETLAKFTPEQLGDEKGARGRGRRGGRTGAKAVPPMAIAGGVVVLGILVAVFLGGKDAPPEETPKATPPAPPEIAAQDRPSKPEPSKVNRTLEQELKQLIADAVREEGTGNFVEAHSIYTQVKLKSKPDHPLYKQADAAANLLKERINAEKRQGKERKPFITAADSERAGAEYLERQEEFRLLLRSFQVTAVRTELDALIARTREATPERAVIEEGIRRLAHLEALMGILRGRASTLSGGKEYWSKYDSNASPDQVVDDADEKGIRVRDTAINREDVYPWAGLAPKVVIRFLDALRSARSGTECLWVAYYCQLLADPVADVYFDQAILLDSSAEMAAEVRALRGS